jgi:hypothetical protein
VYSHIVDIRDGEPFTLIPITMTEGPLKDRRMILLEPINVFRFMDLPPEMRNRVYGYLLESVVDLVLVISRPYSPQRRVVNRSVTLQDYPIGIKNYRGFAREDPAVSKWYPEPLFNVGLLRVSKQVYAEAAPILYGSNTFSFNHATAIKATLLAMDRGRAFLRNVNLRYRGYAQIPLKSSQHLLKNAAKTLRSFTVHHTCACAHGTTNSLEKFFSDILPLLKAVHKVQKGVPNPIDVLKIVKFYWEETPCANCTGYPGNLSVPCMNGECKRYRCADLDEHVRDLTKQFREMLAKELELSV